MKPQLYAETGELSAEMMEQFTAMSSLKTLSMLTLRCKVNVLLLLLPDLSEGDVNIIKNSVGGEESYNQLMSWAGDNLDPADIEAFDALVDQVMLALFVLLLLA